MRRPELLLLAALWEFIAAFIALVGLLAIIIFAFPAVSYNAYGYGPGPGRAGYVGALFGLGIAIVILSIYLVISALGGYGLVKDREWGRMLSIVQAALSLFSIPFGTVIGILIVIYLTRPEIRNYFMRPTLPPPTSPALPPLTPPERPAA
jgi:hypothetical protein